MITCLIITGAEDGERKDKMMGVIQMVSTGENAVIVGIRLQFYTSSLMLYIYKCKSKI